MRFRKYVLAACICCGIVAALISWRASRWKVTLRQELHRCHTEGDGLIFPAGWGFGAGTVSAFRLPVKAATILESRRREELLPCLSELQKSADELGEKQVILYCALVVIHGLRGTPGTVEYADIGSKPKKVSVFDYCLSRPIWTDERKQQIGVFTPTTVLTTEEEETVASPQGQNP